MRWPWRHRQDDHAAAERGRVLELKTRASEDRALEAIANAQRAKARALAVIKENHLGDAFTLAIKEPR